MDYISKQKNITSQAALKQFVQLFPNELLRVFRYRHHLFKVQKLLLKLELTNGKHTDITFFLFLSKDYVQSNDIFRLIIEQEKGTL
ncbi:hypothetical protein LJR153_007153 [Paenibacillus sp. LjRoot153]|uniref:hypothetical protein n=1 Tax=Paenibacillus sp. LjRoot153 TaxID=3342270 RepID=UPI003ED033C4